jgi:hypothetical protein|tara:strand:+ start:60 stop:704 length:645 start_codon:yes stop_codon:yes gene_type:complete
MDEEITIIDKSTRNQRIKNFLIHNKKKFIITISIIFILIIGRLTFDEIKKNNIIKLANQYNSVITDYNLNKKKESVINLTYIINEQDETYSPLALYFIIDNNLIENKEIVNSLFDILINKVNLKPEITNLIIYKKALYNSNFLTESELIKMLNPIINTESIWSSHALYLIGEYFYSNNEKEKSKEFFKKILSLSDANSDVKSEAYKRINRDLSE